jgi:hypothetical protein
LEIQNLSKIETNGFLEEWAVEWDSAIAPTADGRQGRRIARQGISFIGTLRAASLRNDGLCRPVPVQQLRLGPTGRSVHGICHSVPDFMASDIALFSEHVSFLSSEFACGGSMAGLQEPGVYQNCLVLRRKPH